MEDTDWVLVERPGCTDSHNSYKNLLKVTFNRPAKYWTDSIPVGNGCLGAMIWGGLQSELIQLNEDTLWTGIPGNYTNPNAPDTLSAVRKLVDDGLYPEATAASAKLFGNPADVYQPLGDIKIEFDDSHLSYAEETYHRELDLDTATAKVKYSVGDVEFTREYFASNPDKVIAMKISGSKSGSLSLTVSLDSKLDNHCYINDESQIIVEGSCPGKRIPPEMRASYNPKGIQFSAVLDLRVSNSIGIVHVLDNKKLKVEGADWVVLLLAASSSFESPFTMPSDSKKDPLSDSLGVLKSLGNLSYSDLYARHLDDYQKLFRRVSFQLWKSCSRIAPANDLYVNGNKDDGVPTVERIKSFQSDEDPSLVELLFQFGRYLLISSSRPGTWVANLQGIWNKDLEPKWESLSKWPSVPAAAYLRGDKEATRVLGVLIIYTLTLINYLLRTTARDANSAPHLNINLEMNYWLSLPCNLSECHEPLFDFIKSLSVNGSKTAQVNYEASGWAVHHKSDIWAKSSADRGDARWAIWPMGGAWLCTHLWEHYQYTLDKDFLENEAYPLLEGCVSFLLDWLIEGHEGHLETNPSTSPEHMFIAPDGKLACVSYSSTMDMAIIKEVFASFLSASEVLGRKNDVLVQKVYKAQPRLRPTKIAKDGSIMEWALDFKDPEVHHRHLSHLFGLFPGHTITIDEDPQLCKAAENTLYKRGEDGPGWSTAWKVALWARLHNSENAYKMVKHLFKLVDPDHEVAFEGGLYSNLFASHPPFQIDANFGFTAAVAEMLVQSTVKDLYLLPALPRDKWANGRVKGLMARGGLTVSISWKEGNLQEVGLVAKNISSIHRLHYRGTTVSTSLLPGMVYTFNTRLKCINIIQLK